MALVSPGVEVRVIDESFYTPAAAGTVPMIFVASAENKTSSSGAGIAQGTTKANAGRPYLITSQRELGETFGDPLFYSDNNNNMIHAGELNEYGLQTAYSLLGVSNRVYVVRADLDLAKLQPSATAPGGEPADGAYWFDTQVTSFGVLEWNGAPVTTTGGQSFSTVPRIVITEASDLDNSGVPKGSIGAIGDYAVDATSNMNRLYFKSPGFGANTGDKLANAGRWVQVGSEQWAGSWPVVRGTVSNPLLTSGDEVIINGQTVTLSGTTLEALVSDINSLVIPGVSANVVDGALEIYSTGVDVIISGGAGSLTGSSGTQSDAGALGIVEGTYRAPRLVAAPHTQVPAFKRTDADPAPTGSIWIKTTIPNGGAEFRVKQYNSDTQLWETVPAPVFTTAEAALLSLDRSGGGANLEVGDLFVKTSVEETEIPIGDFKIYRRVAKGPTVITSKKIAAQLIAGNYNFELEETVLNSPTRVRKTVVVNGIAGASADADTIAGSINSAGFTNIIALVDSQKRIVIQHKLGGEIRISDNDGLLSAAGFIPFDPSANLGAGNAGDASANLYIAPLGDISNDWVASSWEPLEYTASGDEPLSLTADGELWYSSVVDEVDIMINDGGNWVGYQNFSADYADTNPTGPIVSASEPREQTDGTTLVDGDLWIDTSDLEEYPNIYRYNGTLQEWILLDKTDQTTENGVLFADARWSDAGSNSAAASIEDLLVSDYLDPDAPDPALYPKGMLLWNLRRSGFNVKRFVRNYIDVAGDNIRFQVEGLSGSMEDESMADYYPHRWVTDSSNNVDGSGSFGRHAQRKSVIQALQAMVNSNQDIRDEDSRQFNLMACPGYPELIGEMVTLNYDRRLTAFVVGDTPARLTPDATSLNEWASNVKLAVEDNDDGAVSRDEYLAMYYPWGFTSDNFGNNIVVPPSYMALRTIVLNDQVAFPWFAPAGTRRGGVTNATSSGYVNSEGEFVSIALNTGQRDTLYSNNINPITFISGAGLVVFGQKTRARNASALDRVNVARLIVYLRGQLELLARPYLFEPNDKITRDQIKAAADQLLLELVGLRALYDFLVVCDESNNTPSRIDRNELYLDIAIEPVKAIEFIYIPLRIKNTGEIAALG
jgi:hypothetical protein